MFKTSEILNDLDLSMDDEFLSKNIDLGMLEETTKPKTISIDSKYKEFSFKLEDISIKNAMDILNKRHCILNDLMNEEKTSHKLFA